MKLTFLGAAHEVTGSCSYLQVGDKKLLVDYGMEQGRDTYENEALPVLPGEIDAVVLTHAHVDHSGLLPYLYANGFRGRVHSTIGTKNLCEIMLRDSAHIQEFEAEWRNRKGKRSGRTPYEPLYTMADAEGILACFVAHEYDKRAAISEGIDVRFTDAGHLLGSSSAELWLREGDRESKIIFSGDIGNMNQPLLRDPQPVIGADFVVIESTYGDRLHKAPPDYAVALAAVVQRTLDRGGNVIIPSFAVGRTQELLYFLRRIKTEGLVKGHPDFPVVVDSPLAVQATGVFMDNAAWCYDKEACELLDKGINPIGFEGLRMSVSSQDSIALNTDPEPKVILSASGMCEAGRVKHHLKHNLWRPESTVVFVGYQGVNTLGRSLLEGAKNVKLFGESIAVQAEIVELPGISGHGDRDMLIRWLTAMEQKPNTVFVNHGDSEVCEAFAAKLRDELGYRAIAPFSGEQFDLATGAVLVDKPGVPVQRKSKQAKQPPKEAAALLAAAERLLATVKKGMQRDNRQLRRMTEQIDRLTELWEE
ncbi:MAG: MBL fold metallo-hydrolase [Clostridia bacterium]|nr:MBL fold metallo-hydrolase [Clostridia bacterium]